MKKWSIIVASIILCAFAVYLIHLFYFFDFYKIPSNSMYPTIKPKDSVMVYCFAYKNKPPKRGDVVTFKSPVDNDRILIGRVVGLSNEKVQIDQGHLLIDKEKINDKRFERFMYYNRGKFGSEGKSVIVPENHFYILGDNSANSMDSRYWGFVPWKNLKGKVVAAKTSGRGIRVLE